MLSLLDSFNHLFIGIVVLCRRRQGDVGERVEEELVGHLQVRDAKLVRVHSPVQVCDGPHALSLFRNISDIKSSRSTKHGTVLCV